MQCSVTLKEYRCETASGNIHRKIAPVFPIPYEVVVVASPYCDAVGPGPGVVVARNQRSRYSQARNYGPNSISPRTEKGAGCDTMAPALGRGTIPSPRLYFSIDVSHSRAYYIPQFISIFYEINKAGGGF
jgi:hypothetical protein